MDIEVENALLKRALGYSYYEITEEPVLDANTGCIAFQIAKRVKKEIQPDTTAQIFWLKNRKPKIWRDRKDTVDDGAKVETGVILLPDIIEGGGMVDE